MWAYIVRRVGALFVTLFVVSIVIFVVMRVIPGDPAQIILGTEADPDLLQRTRAALGLDQPLYVQYVDWVSGIPLGDWGRSLTYNTPALGLILSRLVVTAPLAGLSIVLVTVLSIPLGLFAATHHNRVGDYGVLLVSQLGLSIPSFWFGILLILLFSVFLGWFPAGGFPGWENPLTALRSLLLPAVALSLSRAAIVARVTRSSLLEVLGEDYVRTARSKGLHERNVIYRHALRNAMISVVTVLGLQLGALFAGTIVVESVFYLPGMGRMVITSISQRDLPVVQGIVLFIAVLIIVVNFGVDLLYGVLDPRIRYD